MLLPQCKIQWYRFLDACKKKLAQGSDGNFSALGNLQYQYDWVISITDLYSAPDIPEKVRKRWSWMGLLMDGRELTEHLSSGYVHFVSGGILSAVPKDTQPEQVWDYVPHGEIDSFSSPSYHF